MSGCSSGRIAQTAGMVPAVPGYNADSPDGSVALRDVVVVYKEGGYRAGDTAPLALHLFNKTTNQTIKLTRVTSPSGEVCLAGSGQVPIGAGTPIPLPSNSTSTLPTPSASSPSASASASASESASASASASASGSPSASASSSPTPSSQGASVACSATLNVSVPPMGYATLTPDVGTYLAVRGLKEDVPPAGEVDLTFTFEGPNRTIEGVRAPVTTPFSPLPRSPLPLEPSE
jgi:hypothetical protein